MAIFMVGDEPGPLAVLRVVTSIFNFLTQLQDAPYLMKPVSFMYLHTYGMVSARAGV
jgi:hypothetical protein